MPRDGWLSFFIDKGASVIPLKKNDKKPAIKWKKYTEQKLTKEEIEEVLQKEDSKNIGIVCGEISDNLLVLDIDKEELFEKLNLGEIAAKTLTVKTAKGYHIYLRIDDPELKRWIGEKGVKTLDYPPKKKGQDEESHEEIRFQWSDHYVVGPGSIHPSGARYEHLATSPKEIKKAKNVGLLEEIERRWISYHKLEKKGEGVLKEPLLDFIKRYTTPKEVVDQGDYIQMWCPFHKGTSPNAFTIYKSDNHWYDFSEEIGGRHPEFLMRFKGISKKEAYDELGLKLTDGRGVSTSIPLKYADKDFGTLTIKRGKNKNLSIGIESEEFPIAERSVSADFYKSEWYQNVVFKHIKRELENVDYEKFLQNISREIESNVEPVLKTEEGDVEYLTKGELEDGRYFEEIMTDGIETFVVYDTKKDTYEYLTEINNGGKIIYPRAIGEEEINSLMLADGVDEYGSLAELRKEMVDFALTEFDPVDNKDLLELIVYLALTTWIAPEIMENLIEKFCPIVSARGASETGKKRFLTVMRWLTYRSMYVLKTVKVPTLFRMVAPWGATLILDEADLSDSHENADFIEFMNARADGVSIPRYNASTGELDFFKSFGMTVLAERSAAVDDGFESRKIIYPSDATTKPEKYSLIPPEDWCEKGKQLLRKLLLFKFRHMKNKLPTNLIIPNVNSFRVRESLLLLQSLSNEDEEIKGIIGRIAKKLEERIIIERANSMDGLIINTVYGAIVDEDGDITKQGENYEIIREHRGRDGDGDYSTPITLKTISGTLGDVLSPAEVARRWRGLGQGTRERGRIEGKRFRGIVQIQNSEMFKKHLKKYVVDVDWKAVDAVFKKQPGQSTILEEEEE